MGQKALTKVVIPSDLHEARKVQEQILEHARQADYTDHACFAIQLALDEALTNAVHHGNADDPDKNVTVIFGVQGEDLIIEISDQGKGFDPDDLPDPTAEENLSLPNGRGVMLMRAYMTEVDYLDDGRCVRMVKNKSCPLPNRE